MLLYTVGYWRLLGEHAVETKGIEDMFYED